MKKLILIAALFAACTKTVPVQNQNTVRNIPGQPRISDTVTVAVSVGEYAAGSTSRFILTFELSEALVTEAIATVTFTVNGKRYTIDAPIESGFVKYNYIPPIDVTPAFVAEGVRILSIRSAFKYTFNF